MISNRIKSYETRLFHQVYHESQDSNLMATYFNQNRFGIILALACLHELVTD